MSSCSTISQIKPIEITTYNTNKNSDIVYCLYKNETQIERNLGNQVKQGSGGNSYKHYLLRKRGGKRICN